MNVDVSLVAAQPSRIVDFAALQESAHGTNATLQDRDWTSAFGGRTVMQRTSPG
jgi:hypothetical protein